MKVHIAGYNIDKTLIDEIPEQSIATPETISAAYARISRSKKSITELRKASLNEIDKARNSNKNIVFDMGHSSIAEHAVFNIDLIGVSRYLTEYIQKTRLASFTEKSQRYVTLDGDFVLPQEIKSTPLEDEFLKIINLQNNLYEKMYQKGIDYLKKNNFQGKKRELEGRAKEDARYILALATKTQMGMTINARSLTRLLRRLDTIQLVEAHELKIELENTVKSIAPSLIRYTDTEEYEKHLDNLIPNLSRQKDTPKFELLDFTENAEDKILATFLFEKNGGNFHDIIDYVNSLSEENRKNIFHMILKNMKPYHTAFKAFEIANFTFQINMSASCFAQWKRHRLSSIFRSDYRPENGFVIPELLKKIGMVNEFTDFENQISLFYHKLVEINPLIGNYILTNAHKLSVIFHVNFRELYHFSRLRSDEHAQWEIREISQKMDKIVKEKMPNAAKLLMGKSEFVKKR
ncbi:MAG: FAD-dependent thymidylate synthase [Candidatus Cloacimonetes bacterium]|nr:FAD-dependent thymidylate synthase [Candidatus Cloacimonadota bacterium]